jgi:Co/Zn/Cd efflux system component
MFAQERIALALIALITGLMGFFESMIAVPAGSTALAADALSFLQHSISAGFSLQALSGTTGRARWTIHAQGAVMGLLGALVCVVALRRFMIGSVPHPVIMVLVGIVALFAHFISCAIMLRLRRAEVDIVSLWHMARSDAVGNIAVIAAAIAVAATRSNIPDLVIGAGMAALFVISGWRVAVSGRSDAGRAP